MKLNKMPLDKTIQNIGIWNLTELVADPGFLKLIERCWGQTVAIGRVGGYRPPVCKGGGCRTYAPKSAIARSNNK